MNTLETQEVLHESKATGFDSILRPDEIQPIQPLEVDVKLIGNILLHEDFRPFASIGHTVATVVDTADTLPAQMRALYLGEVIDRLYGHLAQDVDADPAPMPTGDANWDAVADMTRHFADELGIQVEELSHD